MWAILDIRIGGCVSSGLQSKGRKFGQMIPLKRASHWAAAWSRPAAVKDA
jgi:hypothetical protein